MPEERPEERFYETLGSLMTNGKEFVLHVNGESENESYLLGNELLFLLREEVSSYDLREAEILMTKLDTIIARRNLTDTEQRLAALEKRRKDPEARTEEEEGL